MIVAVAVKSRVCSFKFKDEKFAVIVDACSSNKKKACFKKKKTEKKIKFPPTNVFYVSINR